MQAEKMRESFAYIAQCINGATQACQREPGTPEEVRSCIETLGQESSQAQQMMQRNIDELELRSFIDRMEEHGDQALQACREAEDLAPDLEHAVRRAHDSISDLKRQLH